MSITALIWGLAAITVFYCGTRVYQAYQKTKNRSVGDFAKYLLIGGAGVIIPVASFFIGGLPWLSVGFVIGVFVKIIGVAYLVRLILGFIYPKFEKIVFFALLFINFSILGVNLKYIANPYPGLNPETGAFPISLPVTTGLLVLIIMLPAFVLPAIIFIRKALKSTDRIVRLRGLLIGLAILFFVVSVSTCGIVTRVVPLFFNNLFVALAALLIFIGITRLNQIEKPEAILPPTVSTIPPYTPIPINW